MDQLTKDAVAATKLGMSYGKYIAKYKPPTPPVERFPKKQQKQEEKKIRCVSCGKELMPGSRSRRYCGPDCAHMARREQELARQRRIREQKKRLAQSE